MNHDHNIDLEATIENTVNDSLVTDPTPDLTPDADATVTDPSTNDDVPPADPSPNDTLDTEPVKDDFAERYGIQGQSFTGKENRIPYSRVKKIVSKAENDAKEALKKQLESEFNPKLSTFETKIKTYEDQLAKVAQFEQVLEKDPQTFLGMLAQHPTYKPFFDEINQLVAAQQQAPVQGAQQGGMVRDPQTGRFVQQTQAPAADAMPQPDKQYADGSVGYSEQGLAALLEWNARNVENRVTQRIEQRYAPIEQDWQTQRRIAEMTPHVERQIAEARTWDRFTELEPEVIQLLKTNPQMSLDRAYMQAYQKNVVPKMAADRNKLRAEVLEELKKVPAQTAAPSRSLRTTAPPNGPRDIEDIIREQIKNAR